MLTRTFCHIPGLGAITEREMWRSGCDAWQTYLAEPDRFSVGSASREIVRATLDASQAALHEGHHQYFASALGMTHAWRAWPDFRDKCVYLDIETDGGQSGSSITTVGLYDGNEFTCLIKGEDLGNFPDIISRYSYIVTFFGSGFDLPMLKKAFPHVTFDQIHLDLCPTLKQLGYKGGLKKIEKQLGLSRGDETDGLTGLDAIRLWREYKRGDDDALRTLIEYNREDVVNLETLANIAYTRLRKRHLADAGVVDLSGLTLARDLPQNR